MEETINHLVTRLKLAVEMVSVVIVIVGVSASLYQLAKLLISRGQASYNRVRLTLARSLVLALEFQLAADILGTALAPSWEQLGKLATVAAIRTFLNYFLQAEVREIGRAGEHQPDPRQSG